MEEAYLVKKGTRRLGPFTLQQMRAMIRSAELGKMYPVSKDDGVTWLSAGTFAELWEVRDLAPLPPPPAAPPTPSGPLPYHHSDPQVVVATLPPTATELVVSEPQVATNEAATRLRKRGWGMGLAGFVTTVAALVLSLAPALIWAMRYPGAYAFVPVIFPLLAASITGLALSAVSISRRGGAFATSGMIVGICGAVLGLVTGIGWAVSNDPREAWIDRMTKTQDADLQLARRNFVATLKRYQDSAAADRQSARERLAKDFNLLTEAYHRLIKVAASTPRFRRHFEDLEGLYVSFGQFKEALGTKEDLDPVAAIDQVGGDVVKLKMLLDMLELYRTREVTLEMAQAKFRDL
jgi:hypothetical protein